MSNQNKFLDELEELCAKYSNKGEWEYLLEDYEPDGVLFKYFYVDVKDIPDT